MNRTLALIVVIILGAGALTAATVPYTFQARTKIVGGDRVQIGRAHV